MLYLQNKKNTLYHSTKNTFTYSSLKKNTIPETYQKKLKGTIVTSFTFFFYVYAKLISLFPRHKVYKYS